MMTQISVLLSGTLILHVTMGATTDVSDDLGNTTNFGNITNKTDGGCQLGVDIQRVDKVIFMIFTVISLLACTFAFVLYIFVRNINEIMGDGKLQHWIHWNLMGSFILRDGMVMTGLVTVTYELRILDLPGGRWSGIVYVYLTTSTYYWMFVEGLYLFLGLKLHLRLRQLRWLKLKLSIIGWVIPGIFVTNWAIERHITNGPFYLTLPTENITSLIITGPIYLLLLANWLMLIYVLFTVGKLIVFEFRKRDTARALAKRTLFLSILLSTHEIIPAIIHATDLDCNTTILVSFVTFIIFSNQGLLVALLYVLSNHEVMKHAIRHLPEPMQTPVKYFFTAVCSCNCKRSTMIRGSAISTLNGGVSDRHHRNTDRDMRTGDHHAFSSYSPSVSSNPSSRNGSPVSTPLPSTRTSIASGLDELSQEDVPASSSNHLLSPGSVLNIPVGYDRQSSLEGVLYRETTFTFASSLQETAVSKDNVA